jgi:hypothetical protein
MKLNDYFRSLSDECHALKGRIEHFIDNKHWLTTGEGKETILRNLISRNLPDTVRIGRGFVVSHENVSTQVDVLFYDASHPVLYRDGDLVFISPSACRGVIEVKTSLSMSELEDACEKLANVAEAIRRVRKDDIFVGIFSYEAKFSSQYRNGVLDAMATSSRGDRARIVNHVALGDSLFAKYWKFHPDRSRMPGLRPYLQPPKNYAGDYRRWHLYEMSGMAYGYFIHNALVSMASNLSVEEENLYFPEDGKEAMRIHERAFENGAQ